LAEGFEETGVTLINIECPELKDTIAKLQAFGAACPEAVKRGMRDWSEQVASESKTNRVPVDTGALRSTIFAKTELADNVITSTIGAGGPAADYAVAVHENIRAGHTGGLSPSGKPYKHWAKTGGPKYIENPLKEALPKLDQSTAAEVEKEMEKVKT
jgi:hypothetical protein